MTIRSALLLSLLTIACATRPAEEAPAPPERTEAAEVEFSADRIEAHMRFLADDLLEGRNTDTRGHELAALYVASRFEAYGLEPAGTDGYMQPVTLRKATIDEEASSLEIVSDDHPEQLESEPDYYLQPSSTAENLDVSGEVVYVGYGVTAPLLGRDDYAGIDAEGKVVALFRGGPSDFGSTERAIYSSTREKIANAIEHGAIGVIELRDPETFEKYTWERLSRWRGRPSLSWSSPDGRNGSSLQNIFMARMSDAGAQKLFATAPESWEEAAAALEEGTAHSFDLGVTLRAKVRSSFSEVTSPNVIGRIAGSELEEESVLILAHLDHLGINTRAEEDEDAIHNGAYDNASGIASMLEVARAFSRSGERPRRSVLFAAVTAEEKGLLGSDYLANNPTPETEDVVAAISIDMFLMLYPMNDVVGFGAEHSTLGASLERAAAQMGVEVSPDFAPEMSLFVRTDHYPFVRRGIPGLFLVHGQDASPEEDGKTIMENWMEERYHDVNDDMNQPIDLEVGARFAKLNYLLIREIANEKERPHWNPGSLFVKSEE